MYKAIIIDDEPYICQMIAAMVDWKILGIDLKAQLTDGITAWEYIEKERPDIVITDIRMPGMDGIELIRRCRELYQDGPINFVVISGFDCFSYAQSAIKYGVNDYILKPINREELKSVLQKIVGERKEIEEKQENQNKMLEHMQYTTKMLKGAWLRRIIMHPDAREKGVEDGLKFTSFGNGGEYRVIRIILDVADKGVVAAYRENCMNRVCEKLSEEMAPFCISVEQVNSNTFILNYDKEQYALIEASWKVVLQKMRNEFMKTKLCQITIGAGCEVAGVEEIWKSASAAENAIMERMFRGCNKLIILNEFTENNRQILEPVEIRQIERSVEILDLECLLNYVDEIYIRLHRTCPNDAAAYYRTAGEIVQAYLHSAKTLHIEEDCRKHMEHDYLHCYSPEQLRSELKENLRQDMERIQEKQRVSESTVVKKAKEYIYQNYMHPLSMEEIAEQVSLNAVYFGTLFKKETGDTVINFLIQYRMEQAKQLLKNIRYNVSEIAQMVGYDDERHFSKQFKKRVGITPKEYRKIHL